MNVSDSRQLPFTLPRFMASSKFDTVKSLRRVRNWDASKRWMVKKCHIVSWCGQHVCHRHMSYNSCWVFVLDTVGGQHLGSHRHNIGPRLICIHNIVYTFYDTIYPHLEINYAASRLWWIWIKCNFCSNSTYIQFTFCRLQMDQSAVRCVVRCGDERFGIWAHLKCLNLMTIMSCPVIAYWHIYRRTQIRPDRIEARSCNGEFYEMKCRSRITN